MSKNCLDDLGSVQNACRPRSHLATQVERSVASWAAVRQDGFRSVRSGLSFQDLSDLRGKLLLHCRC